ncbi:hypothetical protein CRE_01130 [Caenorhabditis remanei]|uniref:Uncharacterized protein n=1 Tax=Caenorhabditis remanei TaxID=31234 RepID=E3MWL3_CAERE|nr:hypothetical protein CRE_01130 [Caenorhabditis remanei]
MTHLFTKDLERERASARLHRLSEESTPSPSVDEAGPSEPAPRLVPQPPRENFPHPISRRPDPISVDQLAAEIVEGATKQAVFIQQAVENAGVADRAPQPIVETPASSIIADRLAGDIVDDAARQAVAINRIMGNAGIADRPPQPLGESSAAPIVEAPASAIIANQLAEDIVGDAPRQAVVIQRAVDNAGVADRAPQPIVEPSAAPTVVTTAESIIGDRISKAVVVGAQRQAAIINHILENAGVADRPPQPLDEPSTAPIVDVPAGPVENVRDEKEEEPHETVKPLARAASPGGKRGHSPDEPTTKRNRRND